MPSGEKPRGQWKSTNQKRSSSAFVNGTDFIRSHGLSRCSGFQPGYHPSRNMSTDTTSAMVPAPCCDRAGRAGPWADTTQHPFRDAGRHPAMRDGLQRNGPLSPAISFLDEVEEIVVD